MKNVFEEGLIKFISVLEDESIGYVIIGALASGIYSLPRATYDIDVLIEIEKIKIPKFLESLKKSGFSFDKDHLLKELTQGYLSEVYYKDVRIDIILPVLPYFREVIRRARCFSLYDKEIRFATCEDVIILKLLSDREYDRKDIAGIKEIQTTIDTDYIKKNIERLIGKETLSYQRFQEFFGS
ncbi:MAG: hypothetical protein AB1422_10140 [bacterium]